MKIQSEKYSHFVPAGFMGLVEDIEIAGDKVYDFSEEVAEKLLLIPGIIKAEVIKEDIEATPSEPETPMEEKDN